MFASGQHCEFDAKENSVPEICHELAEFAILACKKDPFDPMEKALIRLGTGEFGATEHIHAKWGARAGNTPWPRIFLRCPMYGSRQKGPDYVIARERCPRGNRRPLAILTKPGKRPFPQDVDRMAARGLRILGVARATFKPEILPDGQHDFSFSFLGLAGFADPVRPEVAGAVKECNSAGIRVIMITGDYPLTGPRISVAGIGLSNTGQYITGAELDSITDGRTGPAYWQRDDFCPGGPGAETTDCQCMQGPGEMLLP